MTDNKDSHFPVVSEGEIGGASIQTVNARELHAFLQVGKDFSTWIKDRIAQYAFTEGEDFCVLDGGAIAPQNGGAKRGGHNRAEYHISLDMAKELSMVERNEKGKEARQYFIRMEKRAKQGGPVPIAFDPNDPVQLRGLLVNYAERTQIAEARVIELEPKAEAMDRLQASEALEELIYNTPAATLAGIAAKLQFVLEDAEGDFICGAHEMAITSAADDLAGVEA